MTDTNCAGTFTLVLHSHLPYVISHGRWPHGMDWLNEAAAETYVPLLGVLNRLLDEGIVPKTVLGITPILMEQLRNDEFKDEFVLYLKQKIKAAVANQTQFRKWKNTNLARVAGYWRDFYSNILDEFQVKYNRDILGGFVELQDKGAIEIITSAATHGYLPLLGDDRCVEAQVKCGVATYERHCGRKPSGIWLPECAYRPGYKWAPPVDSEIAPYLRKGIEEVLFDNQIKYFVVDSHLLDGGKAIGAYIDRFEALKKLWTQFEQESIPLNLDEKRSPYNIYYVGTGQDSKTVAVLTRDPKTGVQVWSGEHGYPGDGNYLDFHKKNFPGGHRYWKVTGPKYDLADKEEYELDVIPQRVEENAAHFVHLIKDVLSGQKESRGESGVLVSPFDTELFGHWWFEGPEWIYQVLKKCSQEPAIKLATGSEVLESHPPKDIIALPEGSWGEGGFHWIWLNENTHWTWKHVYDAEKKFTDLLEKHKSALSGGDSSLQRILKQVARELLLLESSDWQFLISTWSARDYAELRLSDHYSAFEKLYKCAVKCLSGKDLSDGDLLYIKDREDRDAVFPDIDPSWWT